jgi:hypothetical protein
MHTDLAGSDGIQRCRWSSKNVSSTVLLPPNEEPDAVSVAEADDYRTRYRFFAFAVYRPVLAAGRRRSGIPTRRITRNHAGDDAVSATGGPPTTASRSSDPSFFIAQGASMSSSAERVGPAAARAGGVGPDSHHGLPARMISPDVDRAGRCSPPARRVRSGVRHPRHAVYDVSAGGCSRWRPSGSARLAVARLCPIRRDDQRTDCWFSAG